MSREQDKGEVDRQEATRSAAERAALGPAFGPGPALHPGTRVGDYVIERELARGGMGAVLVAHHATLGRRVALKVVVGAGGRARKRFAREVELTAKLRHPNVIAIHEAGEFEGQPYLVMDLIEGESLAAKVKREGALDPREAAALAEKIARGLAAGHEQGILHRDMKPANVLINERGEPLVADFGLAREVDAGGGSLTQTGQVLGTPAYLPPEQARGDRAAFGPASDVYSLGATLYFLLTRRVPFEGMARLQMIAAAATALPDPPSVHRPGLDPGLDAICMKCLAKAPGERYPDARALGDELQRWLAGEAILARPRRPWAPALAGLALGALVLGLAVWGAARGGEAAPGASEAPGAGQPDARARREARRLSRQVAEAGRALDRAERVADPGKRRDDLDAWLAANPTHPRRDAATASLGRALLEVPRAVVTLPSEQGPAPVTGVVFAPGDKTAITYGRSAILWDVEAGEELRRWTFSSGIWIPFCLDPRGEGFAAHLDVGAPLHWVPFKGPAIKIGEFPERGFLAFSPSGHRLAIAPEQRSGDLIVLSRDTGWSVEFRLKGPPGGYGSLGFVDDSVVVAGSGWGARRVRSGSKEHALWVFDLAGKGELLHRIQLGAGALAFARDPERARYVAAVDGFRLAVYPLRARASVSQLVADDVEFDGFGRGAHEGRIRSVRWRGERLISMSCEDPGPRGEIRLWDTTSSKQLWGHVSTGRDLGSVDLSADGHRALVSFPRGFEVWDLSGLKAVLR